MKMRTSVQLSLILTAAIAAFTSGCGTVSKMQPATSASGGSLKLKKYSRVVVLTPTTTITDAKAKPVAEKACGYFADTMVDNLRKRKVAETIERDGAPNDALVISTVITRCTEGSASLRLWIGMGAGSSYFDATVSFKDGTSGEAVGTLVVDKNSWALGGGAAAAQTITAFMDAAAEKVAEQVQLAMSGN